MTARQSTENRSTAMSGCIAVGCLLSVVALLPAHATSAAATSQPQTKVSAAVAVQSPAVTQSAVRQSVSAALSAEPPRLRSLIEHGMALLDTPHPERPGLEQAQAYALFCQAASHGSEAGHRLAADVAGRQGERGISFALFHLLTAREMGSPGALQELERLVRSAGAPTAARMPVCLTGGEDSFIAIADPVATPAAVAANESVNGFVGSGTRHLLWAKFDLGAYLQRAPQPKRDVAALVRRLAGELDLDPRLALAVAAAESNFEPTARSPKNAIGVMQLIPATAQRFGVQQPLDAEQNIRGGIAYLKWLHRHFNGRLDHVVAAYNAGEGAVKKHGGIPPYAETVTYVERVLGMMQRVVP